MANAATNFFREVWSRVPTRANELAADTKTALDNARFRQRCAAMKLARTVEEVLANKDTYPSET